jgi:hypothetical protein
MSWRGQRVQRRGRDVSRWFGEPGFVFKAFEMGRKPQPVVIDAAREELPFGVGEGSNGRPVRRGSRCAAWCASPCVVIGREGL